MNKPKKPIARWKMMDKLTGLMSIGAGPRGHSLNLDGQRLASVHASRKNFIVQGWYWVGFGINTCNDPLFVDAKSAKAAAMAHYKALCKGFAA